MNKKTNLFVSIIIPTCNRSESLCRCLDSLKPEIQNMAVNRYEVIVTDDSKDNTSKHLIESNYTWVKWIKGSQKGPAANRNNGAKRALGDWYIFIDDDVFAEAGFVSEYVKGIIEYPNSLAFEGAIFPDNYQLLKKDLAECPVNLLGGCFWSANICVNAALLEEIGGFDEDFTIAAQEDQFLFYLLNQKTTIKFLPLAKVIHPVRHAVLKKKIKNNTNAVKNWALFCSKRNMSFGKTIKKGYLFQFRSLLNNCFGLKPKSVVLNIHTLFFALPYLVFKNVFSRRK